MAVPANKTRKTPKTISPQSVELREIIGPNVRSPGYGNIKVPWQKRQNLVSDSQKIL